MGSRSDQRIDQEPHQDQEHEFHARSHLHEQNVIIDEAQNLTPKQMKTLITRAGPGTKIICMGNSGPNRHALLDRGLIGPDLRSGPFQRLGAWRPHHLGTRGERSRLADFASEAL
jgi:PhoH-like ATPase